MFVEGFVLHATFVDSLRDPNDLAGTVFDWHTEHASGLVAHPNVHLITEPRVL